MDLKRINKQIKEAALRLPVNLCHKRPEDLLNVDAIGSLQTGIITSANLIENANAVIKLLAEEVQNLRNENAELKGEQPKPEIKPQSTVKCIGYTVVLLLAMPIRDNFPQAVDVAIHDNKVYYKHNQSGEILQLELTDFNQDINQDTIKKHLDSILDDSLTVKGLYPQSTDNKNDDDDKNEPKPPKNRDFSSEDERKKSKKRKKRRTNKDIKITETKIITFDKTLLPDDAVFKGFNTYVVQDIKFELNNIEYKREEYYSLSQRCSFVAPLPIDYKGSHYGHNVKALIIALHHQSKMTQPAIHEFLATTYELHIAKSTISGILTNNYDVYYQEHVDIVSAGLLATPYIHIDDTSARMGGQNMYVHILCSEYFTAYFTRKHKDRMTILEILGQGIVKHIFDESTYALMRTFGVSDKLILELHDALKGEMTTDDLKALLETLLPGTHTTAKKHIIESSAIIAYQQLPKAIQILICDDAPQFKHITKILALCWVHAARHYKKLMPIIPEYKQLLEEFIDKIWTYYHKLLEYKDIPSPLLQLSLSLGFDELFNTVTGYADLDDRIAKTRSQKDHLLVALDHSEVPLHNNPAELGAREQARRRDISFQTQTPECTKAKDCWMTIVQTAIKLKVNVFNYIKDLITGAMEMRPLAQIIENASLGINSG